MPQPDASLTTVAELRRKSYEISGQSCDGLLAVMAKGLDSMTRILSPSPNRHDIRFTLLTLDFERKVSKQSEAPNVDFVREVAYDVIESLHLTLLKVNERIGELESNNGRSILHSIVEQCTQTDQIPTVPPLLTPKEEVNDVSLFVPCENQMSSLNCMGDGMTVKEKELDDCEMPPLLTPKEEENDLFHSVRDDNQISPLEIKEEDMTFKEEVDEFMMTEQGDAALTESSQNHQYIEHGNAQSEDSSRTVTSREKRRQSRSVDRPVPYAECGDDADGDDEPSMKMRKSSSKKSSQANSTNKRYQVAKKSDTEMECPACEFRSRSAAGFLLSHLKKFHSTTPVLAGIALLCECGEETISDYHARVCKISNFTVIRKGNGPILRFEDEIEKTTPQCILCELYPTTPYGYAQHLRIHHKWNLRANGIYLRCACGEEVFSAQYNPDHIKTCDGSKFTLHKLNEK